MLLRVKKLFWILFILFDFCILAAVVGGVYYLESDGPRLELEKILSEKLGREVFLKKILILSFILGLVLIPVRLQLRQLLEQIIPISSV